MLNSILININLIISTILLNLSPNKPDLPWGLSGWLFRLLVILIVLIIGGLFYKGVRNDIKNTIYKTVSNDFLKPAVIFIFLITIELIAVSYTSWNSNLSLNLIETVYYICSILFVLYWLYKKTQINIIFEILYVFAGIILLFFFKKDAGSFILNNILFEFLPIVLTFTLISFVEVAHLKAEEEKDELNFWNSYIYKLAKTKEKIIAFNVDDYDNFLQPLGLRYFAEQIKEISIRPIDNRIIKSSDNNTETISSEEFEFKKRIFIIKSNLTTESYEINAIKTYGKLTDQQRNFKAIYLMHKSLGIQMYCVSQEELKKYIRENWNFKWWQFWKIKNLRIITIIKKMDKLVLDDTVHYASELNGSLSFTEYKYHKKKKVYLLSTIFEQYKEKEVEEITNLLNKAISKYTTIEYNINQFLDEKYHIS